MPGSEPAIATGSLPPPTLLHERQTDAVLLELRYGNKPVVIVDNRSTIKVGAMDKLPKVIDMVIEAVSAGELDKVLKAALGERRVQPRKVSKISPETAG